MALITYMQQIELAAQKAGVSLRKACDAASVPHKTYRRWILQEVTPRQATAERVIAALENMRTQPEPPLRGSGRGAGSTGRAGGRPAPT